MTDLVETASESVPGGEKIEYLDIRRGPLGFHYTVDRGLPGILQHGLLSRMEEAKRGLRIRATASRSMPDMVYFTTRVNDLYFFYSEHPTYDDALRDVVGIVVARPDFIHTEGHFGEQDLVTPDRFKALVVIDRHVTYKPQNEQEDTYDKYTFGNNLPDSHIKARVEAVRKVCEENGVNLPIYGVSGDLLWPERKS